MFMVDRISEDEWKPELSFIQLRKLCTDNFWPFFFKIKKGIFFIIAWCLNEEIIKMGIFKPYILYLKKEFYEIYFKKSKAHISINSKDIQEKFFYFLNL